MCPHFWCIFGGLIRGVNDVFLKSIIKFDDNNYQWIILENELEKPRSVSVGFFVPDDFISC